MSRLLVVGGASGIGRAVFERLRSDGHAVASIDRTEVDGDPLALTGDVTSDALASVVDRAVELLGGLDGVLNAAGVAGAPHPVVGYPLQEWGRVLDVNLTGSLRVLDAAVPHLGRGGSIVLISSVMGHAGRPGAAAYVASKHALEGLVKVAALELAAQGVRVNSIVPGFIDTELLRAQRTEAERDAIAAQAPVGRLGTGADVAAAAAYLLGPESAFVTGSALRVDGGFLTA